MFFKGKLSGGTELEMASCIEGGYACTGSIDIEPSFVYPGYGDFESTLDDPNDDWVEGKVWWGAAGGRLSDLKRMVYIYK